MYKQYFQLGRISLNISYIILILSFTLLPASQVYAAEACSSSQVRTLQQAVSGRGSSFSEYDDGYGGYQAQTADMQVEPADGSYSNASNSTLYYTGNVTTSNVKQWYNHPNCKKLTSGVKNYSKIKKDLKCEYKPVTIPIKKQITVCTLVPYYDSCSSSRCNKSQGYNTTPDHVDYCDEFVTADGSTTNEDDWADEFNDLNRDDSDIEDEDSDQNIDDEEDENTLIALGSNTSSDWNWSTGYGF